VMREASREEGMRTTTHELIKPLYCMNGSGNRHVQEAIDDREGNVVYNQVNVGDTLRRTSLGKDGKSGEICSSG
jgi:hypothetical protein